MLFPILLSCTPPEPPLAVRSVTFLAINDTYRIEGVPGAGGMARVRQLRRALEVADEDLILTHAGDLLAPSLLSRMYDGEQMIDVLNQLDGAPADHDPRMFVTFGNHEFDSDDCEDSPLLQDRIRASQFTWLASNFTFTDCTEDGTTHPAPTGEPLKRTALIEAGGLTVGLFGLTLDSKHPAYIDTFADPIETARILTADLRAQGADAVVAITHLDMHHDVRLLETLGDDGPDLLLGGHDHVRQWQEVGGRWVIKADADATSASVVRLEVGPEGRKVSFENVPLTGSEDPEVAATIDGWLTRHRQDFCAKKSAPQTCLSASLGHAPVRLVAEELQIRRFETNAGNWIADLMRAEMADQGAQLAFINAGALRLNQTLPAGTPLTQRFVEELLPYPSPLRLIEITGAQLAQALRHGVSDWTGQGHWLQVSGIAFRFDPDAGAISDLTLLTDGAPRRIRDDEVLSVATLSFLAEGNDGYGMLKAGAVIAEGPKLKERVIADLAKHGGDNIPPQAEGRICNTGISGPCLAVP